MTKNALLFLLLALFLQSCASSASKESRAYSPPAEARLEDHDQEQDELSTLTIQFEDAMAVGSPDCGLARSLRDRICELADKICSLEQEEKARCEDSKQRCEDAKNRTQDRCG